MSTDGIDPNVEAFNAIFTTIEKPPACKCEFVNIGVGYQKVAETDDCARCTPYGLASAIMVALLPHFTAERAVGWREAIAALRDRERYIGWDEEFRVPWRSLLTNAQRSAAADYLESLAPKETP